jgi:hypothetical protein
MVTSEKAKRCQELFERFLTPLPPDSPGGALMRRRGPSPVVWPPPLPTHMVSSVTNRSCPPALVNWDEPNEAVPPKEPTTYTLLVNGSHATPRPTSLELPPRSASETNLPLVSSLTRIFHRRCAS